VRLTQQHFADLPTTLVGEPPLAEYRGGEFREARDLDQVHIVLGFPSVSYTDPDFYASMMLSTLLGGGMSSRLFQEVREKRGLVYSIYSFTAPSTDSGLFGIYAGTGESEAEELMPVTLEELRRVQHDVTEVELHRARAQAKAGILMSLESTGSRCEQLARQIQIFGRIVPVKEMVAKIEAVRTEDVCRAASRLFRAKPTLAVLGPAGKVPGLTTIAEKLAA
jgi:predicted Zn-dependent peptidase